MRWREATLEGGWSHEMEEMEGGHMRWRVVT